MPIRNSKSQVAGCFGRYHTDIADHTVSSFLLLLSDIFRAFRQTVGVRRKRRHQYWDSETVQLVHPHYGNRGRCLVWEAYSRDDRNILIQYRTLTWKSKEAGPSRHNLRSTIISKFRSV